MQPNRFNNEESGSIGIGAMIVFIALILVAAVASAVIIQTGEKLQQNAQKSGDDTQREISGKITINSAFVVDTGTVRLYIESAPGSGVLAANEIATQVTCENTDSDGNGIANDAAPASNDGYQFAANFMSDADGNAETNEVYLMSNPNDVGAAGTEVAILSPGVNYMIDIDTTLGVGADCDITELGVNAQMTLWIHVQSGGSSYELLYIGDTTPGTSLI